MNGLTLSLLTGLGATDLSTLVTEVKPDHGITYKRISYAIRNATDAELFPADVVSAVVSKLASPEGALQEKAARNFTIIGDYFGDVGFEADPAFTDAPVDSDDDDDIFGSDHAPAADDDDGIFGSDDAPAADDDDGIFGSDDAPAADDDDDIFGAAEPTVEDDDDDIFGSDDDIFGSDDDLLDLPSVGAEPVVYDRKKLESDMAGVVTTVDDKAPEVKPVDDGLGL